MLMNMMRALSALGAFGIGWAIGVFASWRFLWQLPLLFLGLLLGQFLLLFLTLVIWCACIDLTEPVEEDSPRDRKMLNLCVGFAMSLLRIRFHTTGREKLPAHGRFMLVCNHRSIADPVMLLAFARDSQLAFISKQENNGLLFVNKLMHRTLCQLLNRENDREALITILKCVDILKAEKASIAVFPEGYVSREGSLLPFRNGVFKIAQRAGVPIVVCTLRGTAPIFHNFWRGRRNHVYLDLLEIIPPEDLKGSTKEVGDRIHAIMAKNLGKIRG